VVEDDARAIRNAAPEVRCLAHASRALVRAPRALVREVEEDAREVAQAEPEARNPRAGAWYPGSMLDGFRTAPAARPLSRAEYERMVAAGWFEDARVELLKGVLVEMSPQGARHVAIIRRLTRFMVQAVGNRAEVQVQGPLALLDHSEPEPDLALVPAGYEDELPARAHLVIEVADSSLPSDRGVKAEVYAEAGVPEYWIVNVAERVVEVHREPQGGAYRERFVRTSGEALTVTAFPDIRIEVIEIFQGPPGT
jgi:Uma2 family endonuclease